MGRSNSTQHLITMSKIIAVLACLAVVLAVVSAESKPGYHKLEKLGCTLDQVILCAGEIEAAWNNCWDSADIQGCIAGILGASDCGLCICDVLGWLGLMECLMNSIIKCCF